MSIEWKTPIKKINFEETTFETYKGQVIMVVNVASKCGFTPQYKELEEIYSKYKDQGFVILGFPCNQFGSQESGDEKQIQSFCEINFGVTFPLFAKVNVNGASAHPLFTQLKKSLPGLLGSTSIKWNFTKFLIGKDGKPISRYSPNTKPKDIEPDIVKALK